MGPYLVRRLGLALLSLLVVSITIFAATNVLPGDPATAILGKEATPQRLAQLRAELGLNDSVAKRYVAWLGGVVTGDFGRSTTQGVGAFAEGGAAGTPVTKLTGQSIRNSAILASVALALLVALSIVIGTLAALRAGSPLDAGIQLVGLVFIALPEFVLGAFLIIVFAFLWPILPAVSLNVSAKGLVLPAATLVLSILGVTVRLVRVGVVEVLSTNYVVNARLRGIPERQVIRRHVLPNSLGPTLQVFAMATGLFVGGMVVVEYLFGYPGIGTGFVSAVSGRDYPVVEAYTLILAAAYVMANMIADLLTVLTNPRLRAAVTR